MSKQPTYRNKYRTVFAIAIAAICAWGMSGHALWEISTRICYQYVHHLKSERSFRDTLVMDINTFNDNSIVVWTKPNEIRYAGKMFDIKKTFAGEHDKILLVGHYDDFEHECYKALKRLMGTDKNQPQQNADNSWIALIAILPQPYANSASIPSSPIRLTTAWNNCFFHNVSIPPLLAPPDVYHNILA